MVMVRVPVELAERLDDLVNRWNNTHPMNARALCWPKSLLNVLRHDQRSGPGCGWFNNVSRTKVVEALLEEGVEKYQDATQDTEPDALKRAVAMAAPYDAGGITCVAWVCRGCDAASGARHKDDCEYVALCKTAGMEPLPIPPGAG